MTQKQKALLRNPSLQVLKKDPYSRWVSLPCLPPRVRIGAYSGWWFRFIKKRITTKNSMGNIKHYHRPARHKRRKQWHFVVYSPAESFTYLMILGEGRSEIEAWKDYNARYDNWEGKGMYKNKKSSSLKKY